jgi:hypothetical protein
LEAAVAGWYSNDDFKETDMSATQVPATYPRDPDLDVDIHKLIDEVVPDPDTWKVTPNPVFGLKRPVDLIGEPEEAILRDTLRAAKQGAFS